MDQISRPNTRRSPLSHRERIFRDRRVPQLGIDIPVGAQFMRPHLYTTEPVNSRRDYHVDTGTDGRAVVITQGYDGVDAVRAIGCKDY